MFDAGRKFDTGERGGRKGPRPHGGAGVESQAQATDEKAVGGFALQGFAVLQLR